MATKYPYVGVPGAITTIVEQLRKAFPANVTADTLKKWGIAPKNESYLLSILRFIGVTDEEGGKLPDAGQVFATHDDDEFAEAFGKLVRSSYSELFDLFGDDAWDLAVDKLIGFFRTEDESSATVGQRQAATFRKLAALSGHGDPHRRIDAAATKSKASAKSSKPTGSPSSRKGNAKGAAPKSTVTAPVVMKRTEGGREVALTVRIEINLPATNEQQVYDKIFKSIKANLIDAE